MNCSPDLMEAYVDNELDASQRAALEQHLAACSACSDALARLQTLQGEIRASAPYFKAPSGLRASIVDTLRQEAAPPSASSPQAVLNLWRGIAIAGVLLVASLSWNLAQLRMKTRPDQIAQELVGDHIRSLIGTHLLDVPSSDQHTVKPWFAGKLDFSPDVRDLSAQGFPLDGGRVEYLSGRRVAALVFHRRLHVINLFIWPGALPGGEKHLARDGYNLLGWSDGVMTYWAVSDVSPPELETLRALYR